MNSAAIHWWAWRPDIEINPAICPASPEGVHDTAKAFVLAADWQSAFTVAFFITVIVAVFMVFVTYETRAMGDRFRGRWWMFLGITALLAAVISFAWLATTGVHTAGCQFGTAETKIPTGAALARASVSLVQAILLFVAVSWLLTLIAKATRRATWYNNSQFGSLFHF